MVSPVVNTNNCPGPDSEQQQQTAPHKGINPSKAKGKPVLFSELKLHPLLLQAVATKGYQQATEIQAQAIPVVLSGADLMAGAQTGTGKTAAFALPILHEILNRTTSTTDTSTTDASTTMSTAPTPHGGVKALILTPTRELAQQVYNSFIDYAQGTGIRCVIAYGGVSFKSQSTALKRQPDILIATPGRLIDHLFKGSVTLDQLQTLVFDEADRMLDLGFKDEINRILKRLPKQRQTLLFSATFEQHLIDLAYQWLNQPTLIEVTPRNSTAAKVEQRVYTVNKAQKREITSYLIGVNNWHQVLVFTRTKETADSLAKEMVKDGIQAQAIHGDKTQAHREKTLAAFKDGSLRALIATDIAARGLDIPQLKYVFNYQLPFNAEDYIHRVGRTGRAGEDGLAITLLCGDEQKQLSEIEALLDQKLPQQWLPGYEPDLNQEFAPTRQKTKKAARRRIEKHASQTKRPRK